MEGALSVMDTRDPIFHADFGLGREELEDRNGSADQREALGR